MRRTKLILAFTLLVLALPLATALAYTWPTYCPQSYQTLWVEQGPYNNYYDFRDYYSWACYDDGLLDGLTTVAMFGRACTFYGCYSELRCCYSTGYLLY